MGEYATNLLLDLIHTGKEKKKNRCLYPQTLLHAVLQEVN